MPNEQYDSQDIALPRRLQSIDHTVRNSAETLHSVAYSLQRVTDELSSERRAMSADRVRLESLYGPDGEVARLDRKNVTRMEETDRKLEQQSARITTEIAALDVKSEKRLDSAVFRIEEKFDTQYEEICREIKILNGIAKWAAGALTVTGIYAGWLVHTHKF